MKLARLAGSVATAVVLLTGLGAGSATAGDADGDSRPCATGKEFRAIKVAVLKDGEYVGGTPQGKVRAIFDSDGEFFRQPPPTYRWTRCNDHDRYAYVGFGTNSGDKTVAIDMGWAKY